MLVTTNLHLPYFESDDLQCDLARLERLFGQHHTMKGVTLVSQFLFQCFGGIDEFIQPLVFSPVTSMSLTMKESEPLSAA